MRSDFHVFELSGNLLLGRNTTQCQVWVQTIVIAKAFNNSKLLKSFKNGLMETNWKNKTKSCKNVGTRGFGMKLHRIFLFLLKYDPLHTLMLISLEMIHLSNKLQTFWLQNRTWHCFVFHPSSKFPYIIQKRETGIMPYIVKIQ